MSESKVKIIGLKVSGIRKIAAIEMQLVDKGLIPIVGKNRQGKSTILDAVESLFAGKKSLPDDMVKHGLTKGVIEAEIDAQDKKYFVERVVKADGTTTLKVVDKDGNKINKPQEFLSGLVNDLTFDPQPFLMKNTADKLKFLMQLLKIDVTEDNKKIKEMEDERLLVGRELKGLGNPESIEKVERIDIVDKLKELQTIQARNAKVREEKVRREAVEAAKMQAIKLETENAMKDFRAVSDEILKKKAQIEAIKEEVEKLEKKKEKAVETINKPEYIAQPVDCSDIPEIDEELIQEELRNAAEINLQAEKYLGYCKTKEAIENKEKGYKLLSEKIKKMKEAKLQKLSSAKMPVDGLEIVLDAENKADGVYFNGSHCENWSDSESVSVALRLCAAMNPALRAVFIDRGESFDREGLAMLNRWAEENDMQAIIAIVDDIPTEDDMEDGVFYIEEGAVKYKAPEKVEGIEEVIEELALVANTTPELVKAAILPEKMAEDEKEPEIELMPLGVFETQFCWNCKNDDVEAEKYCSIHTKAMAGIIVNEWTCDSNGKPYCTKFEKK